MAICERTPDSMWSMRCEIGWPTAMAAGRLTSRVRMSADLTHWSRQFAGWFEADIELADMPFGMPSSSARPLRRRRGSLRAPAALTPACRARSEDSSQGHPRIQAQADQQGALL